jgi:hypothetical protein
LRIEKDDDDVDDDGAGCGVRMLMDPTPAAWHDASLCVHQTPISLRSRASLLRCLHTRTTAGAGKDYILAFASGGFAQAQAACAKDHRCTSFALLTTATEGGGGDDDNATRYETYTGLRNDSAVPNPQWDAYAMARCPPPPYPIMRTYNM